MLSNVKYLVSFMHMQQFKNVLVELVLKKTTVGLAHCDGLQEGHKYATKFDEEVDAQASAKLVLVLRLCAKLSMSRI